MRFSTNIWSVTAGSSRAELDTGRVHPRVGSGRVGVVGAVVQLVEYRTRNQEVAGSTHTRSVPGGSGWVGSNVKRSNKYPIYTQETDYSSTIIPNDKKL